MTWYRAVVNGFPNLQAPWDVLLMLSTAFAFLAVCGAATERLLDHLELLRARRRQRATADEVTHVVRRRELHDAIDAAAVRVIHRPGLRVIVRLGPFTAAPTVGGRAR